ncbi:MAG: hypothetical protein KC656_24725 [Myxococcales bacterium]|nr:hypothetical protein [Myxococcales bacterium]
MRARALLALLVACTTIDGPALPDTDVADTTPVDAIDSSTPAETDTDPPGETLPPVPDVGDDTGCDSDVDTQTDPLNCGGCGRTCIVPFAEAICVDGACAVGTCEAGLLHCDDSVANGCETPDTCVPGAACTIACGAEGTVDCTDACTPVCAPPVEQCNALDDDCDGACDEGPVAGCRVGVHRAFGSKGHLFTTDRAAWQAWGTPERENFFWLYTQPATTLRPLFQCAKANGNFFLSTSTDCEATGAPRATFGFIAPAAICGAVPLHRLYSPTSGWHFFPLSEGERDNAVQNLGWETQGIAGYVWTAP